MTEDDYRAELKALRAEYEVLLVRGLFLRDRIGQLEALFPIPAPTFPGPKVVPTTPIG